MNKKIILTITKILDKLNKRKQITLYNKELIHKIKISCDYLSNIIASFLIIKLKKR